jgi:hypothetical protein
MFHRYQLAFAMTLLSLTVATQAVAEMSADTRRRVCEFAQERDRAGEAYLKGWLKGDSPETLAPAGAVLAAREAAIVALSNGNGAPERCRAILFGKRFEPEMVPALLIEAWGASLDPKKLFAGQTFIVDTSQQ